MTGLIDLLLFGDPIEWGHNIGMSLVLIIIFIIIGFRDEK